MDASSSENSPVSPVGGRNTDISASDAAESLVDKLMDWLKSPAVLGGGALLLGLLAARLLGRDLLRQWLGKVVADYLKTRGLGSGSPAPASSAMSEASAAGNSGSLFSKETLAVLAGQAVPLVVDAAKKMLAQTAAKKQ